MTMDRLYLAITIVLVFAALVRIPTVIRQPHARLAWFATLMAVPALLTRGALVPIERLDAWMGRQNLIFLVQCWLATFAFWGLCEAAGADTTRRGRMKLRLWIPLAWCVSYSIPFFMIGNREGTELFFIDAHVDDPAAIVCGSLYMLGIAAICARLLWQLRARTAGAHWVFRSGAILVAAGSILWTTAIVIDHVFELHRTPILWMYGGFDVLFYPGVVALALGLVVFAVQRQSRQLILRRRVRALQAILARHGVKSAAVEDDLPFTMYDLVVQIEDLRTLAIVIPTAAEEKTIARSTAWVERAFPQIHDLSIAEAGA